MAHFFFNIYYMPTDIKIKIDKIYAKIDRIAKLGRDYQMNYKKYIDELFSKGDYIYFTMCLETYYDIDIRKYNNLYEVKDLTWPIIIEKTKSAFLEKLKKLYISKGVYQIGHEIRSENTGNSIMYLSDTLGITYSEISGTSSKIGFTTSNGIVNIDIIDDHLYNININKVNWGASGPIITNFIQTINSGVRNDVMSYTGSLTNTKILDNIDVLNSVDVSSSNVLGLTELELKIDITHSYIGDLLINLKAPNGKIINVKRNNVLGSEFNNYKNVKFTTSENYKKLTVIKANNLSGKFQMDKYAGVGTQSQSYISTAVKLPDLLTDNNFDGNWELFIRDISSGDKGTLNYWNLDFSILRKNDYFTQSSYPTQIPMTHGATYLIEVEKKDDYGKFYYRLDIVREDVLGTITEVSIDNYLESNYYYKNKQLAEILGYKKTFLEVKKNGSTDVITIAHIDTKSSEEMNLYQRYAMAIDYLLS